ncbi:MAG: hypothetical protein IJY35_06335, partial [Clostridia bacterium]|nr:hypothetical protein [Clostridia bacterium]
GGLLAFGNYYFLSVGIMMALASGDEKQAKRKMRTSRIARTVVQLGVIAFAILFPHRIHWLPVILSTFFPRILIGVKGYWDFMRHRNDPIPVSDTPAEPDDDDEENADGFEKFVSHFSKGNIPGENAGEDKK